MHLFCICCLLFILKSTMNHLEQTDPELYELIHQEEKRQHDTLMMIPSENLPSMAVQEAVGSILMSKYSEGQVKKRYYQGNNTIDEIELLTKKRALQAFSLDPEVWGVNVQAVVGSVANLAVYNALINPGDTIMGMYLYDGGHLSHGWQLPDGKKISFTSKIYRPVYYHVDLAKGEFDYAQVEKTAKAKQPKILISGGTAYPRTINHKRLRAIADKVGAYYMADIAHESGLVLAGEHPSPFDHAHVVTMTTRKTMRGPIGAIIFARKEYIDAINSSVFPGLQGGPQNHSIAGIGVALYEAMQPHFKKYAKQVVKNAKLLASELQAYDFTLVSGGTDKHLVLIDLANKELLGNTVAEACEEAGIILNRNTIPYDRDNPQYPYTVSSPFYPMGIRLGTPGLTSRGMKEKEMKQIASWIHTLVNALQQSKKRLNLSIEEEKKRPNRKKIVQNTKVLVEIREKVRALCKQYPLPEMYL